MHARKLPRISEPSFDKDYYDKYKSSAAGAGSKSSGGYVGYRDRRSMSPTDSPRDRSGGGGGKNSYRIRGDRDYYNKYSARGNKDSRDRDRHLRDRSPKDRGKWDSRDKQRDKDVESCGDWSEHISSTGKKYYYNSRTEVSQWEKPHEWLERERSRNSGDRRESSASNRSMYCDRSNRPLQDSGSSSKHSNSNASSRDYRDNGRYSDLDRRKDRGNNFSSSAAAATTSGAGDMDIVSSRDATPTSENDDSSNHASNDHSAQPLSAALPKMTSHPTSYHSSSSNHHYPVSTQDALKTIQNALLFTSSNTSTHTSPANSSQIHSATASAGHTESPYSGGGPPTPTHSEDQGGGANHNSSAAVPSSSSASHHSSSSAALTLTQSPLTALKPQLPTLTPSLAKYYKESLIGHVTVWPSESVEKACQRINEDHNNISNLGITKVSAELKMARSLVRLAEIQATLQEQRILFLRQQSLDLESMRLRPPSVAQVLQSDDASLRISAANKAQ